MYIYGGKDANGQTLGDCITLENVSEFCACPQRIRRTLYANSLFVATRASMLGADLLRELEQVKYADFEIVPIDMKEANGKPIKAHRAILSARCSFFKAMLQADKGARSDVR